ncbi:MAG: M1 family metallopeptidase [Bacteroidetes bacterium]|nr:M1 family metallopeptidase [Bacteroidota bacterium]
MRPYILILLAITSQMAQAQNTDWAIGNTYRSESNALYWKNKLPYEGYWQQDVYYKISASLDDSAEVISGTETLKYYNNSPNILKEAYFHLYQNAVQPGSLVDELYNENKTPHTFGRYEKQGLGTQILSATVNGESVIPSIHFTVMKLPLNQPLQPGDSVEFSFTFKTYFDRGSIRRRMKVYDHHGFKHFNGVHWYPRICVYDRKFSWETAQHMEHEFYGDYGAYDVELKLPTQYINEATGVLLNPNETYPGDLRGKLDISNFRERLPNDQPQLIAPKDGKYKTWRYHADNVHDFAWTADPTYRIGEVVWNGIHCIALAQEQNAWKWQPSATFVANVISTYSKDFGMYEYPKMVAADAADGMEYPMLTLDGGEYPGHQGLIAHEVGHNWFFGMIGSNETYRASLDEGFTQFLTAWSMKKLTGQNQRPSEIEYNTNYFGYLRDAIDGIDPTLNTHSDDFNNAIGHGGGYGHVYYKTATMLYNLEYVLGDSIFKKAMQDYVKQWKICHPYAEDFRNSIIMSANTDLNWFFDQWMETSKYVDYGIKKVKKLKSGEYDIQIKRKGDMIMPLDLRIYLKDGSKFDMTIPVSNYAKPGSIHPTQPWLGWGFLNPEYDLKIKLNADIKNVQIDPSGRLADIYMPDNLWKRKFRLNFDKGVEIARYHRGGYKYFWRPDLWYSYADGLRAGVKFSGNYAARKHIFNAYLWYNSGLLSGLESLENSGKITTFQMESNRYKPSFSYHFDYQNYLRKNGEIKLRSSAIAGSLINQAGWEKDAGKGRWITYLKQMNSGYYYKPYSQLFGEYNYQTPFSYLPTQQFWSNMSNISFNLKYKRNYRAMHSNGFWELGGRTTTPWSETVYGYVQFTWNQSRNVGKTNFRSRYFLQAGQGKNPAAESMLYAAGANPEEIWDNKYVRDLGMMNINSNGYLANGYGSFPIAMGGGLNLRGFTGYQIPHKNGDSIYLFYRGNSGTALNVEWEFSNLFSFVPKVKMLKCQVYAFGDVGCITYPSGSRLLQSGLLADAGLGFILNISHWQNLIPKKQRPVLTGEKPLIIRADFPLFVNAVQSGESNLAFRWLLAIGAAF